MSREISGERGSITQSFRFAAMTAAEAFEGPFPYLTPTVSCPSFSDTGHGISRRAETFRGSMRHFFSSTSMYVSLNDLRVSP